MLTHPLYLPKRGKVGAANNNLNIIEISIVVYYKNGEKASLHLVMDPRIFAYTYG